jgi:hypothetical protein
MNYKLVYICSPLRPVSTEAAEKEAELNNNIALARDACTLAVYRGFLPVAPHLYFPQFLNDEVAAERNLSLDMGKALLRQCTQLWIISPRISNGMSAEIKEAQKYGIPVLVFTAAGLRPYRGNSDTTDNCYVDTFDGVID